MPSPAERNPVTLALPDAGLEPAGSAFRYHAPDVDVVPADRVGDPEPARPWKEGR